MKISKKLKVITKILTVLILIICGLNINNQKAFSYDDFIGGQERLANNTGSSASQNMDFGPYMQRMQDKIKGNWNPPAMTFDAQIVVKYRILKDGSLDSYGIATSSGSQELDNAAIDALKRSAPFEMLPESFNKESILVQFTFDYKKPQNVANNAPVQQKPAPVAAKPIPAVARTTPVATQPTQTVPVQPQAPAKIRTLAVSPFGDAEATTYKNSQAHVQSRPSGGTLLTAQPQVPQQPKTQPRPQRTAVATPPPNNQAVAVSTQRGTLVTTQNMLPPETNYSSMAHNPNAAVAKSAPAIRGLNNDTQQPIKVATRQYTTPNGTLITTEKLAPGQYLDGGLKYNEDQSYTTAPALAPPSVNPRRTVDIDTFADPDQLPLALPVGGEYGQIAKQTVIRTDAPITTKEINRATLPITYDPEIERVIIEEDLPPIETPMLSSGVNKVAAPACTHRRVVVQEPQYIEEPQYVETYVPVAPVVYSQPPAPVTSVVVPDFDAYMAKVSRRITRKWHPPFSDYSTIVVVNYIIKKNGELGNYYISKSSGNSRMDASATKALEKAAPFPPLPAGFDEDSVDVKFTFDYNVYKNKSEKRGIKKYEQEEQEDSEDI